MQFNVPTEGLNFGNDIVILGEEVIASEDEYIIESGRFPEPHIHCAWLILGTAIRSKQDTIAIYSCFIGG